MKRILLPTDFSENAYNAVKYAVQLFSNEKCTFYLLNTYTPVIYDNEYILYNATQPTLEEIYRTNSSKGLEKVAQRIRKDFPNPNHSFSQISSFNMLNEEIKKQVDQKNIELIIMGTQGATGADEILFGTHTVHAMKKAHCPLLAIPSGYEYKDPKHILFPTDYGIEYGEEHLGFMQEMAVKYSAKINILNVYLGEALSEEQEKAKKELAAKLVNIDHQFYSVEKHSVPEAITDFQKENPVDIVFMINNKHSFFESLLFKPVINRIGFRIKVPFLVIPSGKHPS